MESSKRRIDCDAIAHLYDAQPLREKDADAELRAWLENRPDRTTFTVLDIGCGTGNQLVANQSAHPDLRYVGVDRFPGMLQQARPKSSTIAWVQADASSLPFAYESVDFVSSQFMFHHLEAKGQMLREVFRLLRPAGRFVLTNLCPQEAPDGLLYQYFPAAWEADVRDFWRPERIRHQLHEIGFSNVDLTLLHLRPEQSLGTLLAGVERRDTCSQLLTIPDAAYRDGVARLRAESRRVGGDTIRRNYVCLLTVRGDRS